MKNAFEQIYGAPFLARLLFVEIGAAPADDLFLEVEYDGAINLRATTEGNRSFAVLAATKKSAEQMAEFLRKQFRSGKNLAETLDLALDSWVIGQLKADDAVPGEDEIRRQRHERLGNGIISAAVLERDANTAVRYRALEANELAPLIAK
jgi:proteasome alpha subunit